jgi:hypothetical protein
VVDLVRTHVGVHALRHETLGLRQDHVILFRDEVPTRDVMPARAIHRCGDAGGGYRPLHGCEEGLLLGALTRSLRVAAITAPA